MKWWYMDELLSHCATWKKPVTILHIVWLQPYAVSRTGKFIAAESRWGVTRPGGRRKCSEWEWGYWSGDENILNRSCWWQHNSEDTKNHWILPVKRLNFMAYDLYLRKAIFVYSHTGVSRQDTQTKIHRIFLLWGHETVPLDADM